MARRNKLILSILFLLYILAVFFVGLWPFSFNSTNGVDWLKTEQGIYFHEPGNVYGPAELNNSDRPSLQWENGSISIELWLTPGEDDRRGFSYIFCLYDDQQPEVFSLSQVTNLLNISKYQSPGNRGLAHNWRWLQKAFSKGQRRFLTITSDKNNTTVYIDGEKATKFQNFPLMPVKKLTSALRIVMGNDPTGNKPWSGKVHGMALYNHSLSSEQVIEHFEKWQNNSTKSLLKEKEVIALYPMDEQKGNLIHNAVDNQYNLLISERVTILKKNFLELYANNLSLNDANLRDIRINILGFIPLGYLFFWVLSLYIQTHKTSAWRLIIPAILGGITVSLIIEIFQGYLPIRYSSITDLVSNTSGAILGIILALIHIKLKKSRC